MIETTGSYVIGLCIYPECMGTAWANKPCPCEQHGKAPPPGYPLEQMASGYEVTPEQLVAWYEQHHRGLRKAFQNLVDHIERITYRDSAGLRLGDTVPQFEQAKEALSHE